MVALLKLFAAVVLAAFGAVDADIGSCGTWGTANMCEIPEGIAMNGGVVGTMQMFGTVAGDFYIDYSLYPDCNMTGNEELFYAHAYGDFNDLGPYDLMDQNVRKMTFNFTILYVTPMSDIGVTELQGLCPCPTGNAWAVNETKYLSSCDPSTCSIEFVGVDANVQMHSPAYTLVNITDEGFKIGRMYDNPAQGFGASEWLEYTVPLYNCTTEANTSLCGEYSTVSILNDPCEIIIDPKDNSVAGSRQIEFKYRGPNSATPNIDSYGVYHKTVYYFSDSKCMIPEATVKESGSMGYDSRNTDLNLYVVKKNAANLVVTPAFTATTWATVLNLSTSCPCGFPLLWGPGVDRTITSCPTGTCTAPVFNDWNDPGFPLYAFVSKNETQIMDLGLDAININFGSYNISDANLDNGGLNSALQVNQIDNGYCSSSGYSKSFCGTYEASCSTSAGISDTTTIVTLTGAESEGSEEGQIAWTQSLFNTTGGGCQASDKIYSFVGSGFYSQDNYATVPDVFGAASVNIQFDNFIITCFTPEACTGINDNMVGCPCGGSFYLGVPRKLTICPANSCSLTWRRTILPGGVFGEPGYGVMQLNTLDATLRISTLSDTPIAGYAQEFNEVTGLLTRGNGCPVASFPQNFGGCWYLPCYAVAIPQGGTNYSVSGTFDAVPNDDSKSGLFLLNKTISGSPYACNNASNQLFAIQAEGEYATQSASPNVNGGYVTKLNTYKVTILPLTDKAQQLLQNQCGTSPGCKAFISGAASIYDSSTACACPFLTSAAGLPIRSGNSFGIAKTWDYPGDAVVDDVFRMTYFVDKISDVPTLRLLRDNGQFTTASNACPYGPKKRHDDAQQQKNEGGLKGGDLFILLLFVFAVIYFGGGMVLNFQRTGGMKNGGTPVIPHVTFWRAIPGLVADGMRFSLVECFGFRGGKGTPKYRSVQGGFESNEGYGAL